LHNGSGSAAVSVAKHHQRTAGPCKKRSAVTHQFFISFLFCFPPLLYLTLFSFIFFFAFSKSNFVHP
jgi:hypothetical protein